MRSFLKLFSISFCLFCFNLRQAQAQGSPPATGAATVPAPTAPTGTATLPAPIQAITPTPPPGAVTTSGTLGVSAAVGKYYEYQSYCRAPLNLEKKLTPEEFKKNYDSLLQIYNTKKSFVTLEPLFNLFIDNDKVKEAANLYNEQRQILPTNQQDILQARLFYAQKKYHDALSLLEKFSEEVPNDVAVLTELSKSYVKSGNLFEAKSALQDALKLDKKNNGKYLRELCMLEFQDSNHEEVEKDCLATARLFPKDSLPIVYLGMSYRERLDYKNAQKQFEAALKIEKTEFALTCLGENYILQKNYPKAIETFKADADFEPRSGRALLGAANAFYQTADYVQALVYFTKACPLDRSVVVKIREAQKPLEAAKLKIANDYYQEAQKCSARF